MPDTKNSPKPMRRRRFLPFLLAGASALGAICAQAAEFSEYEVKAGFLLKFLELTDWPGGASFSIGVLGDDPFGGILDRTVQGQKVKGRPVTVRRSRRVEDLRNCNVVFVSRSERQRMSDVASGLAGSGVLSVGDFEQFARQGGVVGMVLDREKVRLQANPGAAKQHGIKLSSRLLKAAEIVGN